MLLVDKLSTLLWKPGFPEINERFGQADHDCLFLSAIFKLNVSLYVTT